MRWRNQRPPHTLPQQARPLPRRRALSPTLSAGRLLLLKCHRAGGPSTSPVAPASFLRLSSRAAPWGSGSLLLFPYLSPVRRVVGLSNVLHLVCVLWSLEVEAQEQEGNPPPLPPKGGAHLPSALRCAPQGGHEGSRGPSRASVLTAPQDADPTPDK